MKFKRIIKYIFLSLLIILIIGYCLPQHFINTSSFHFVKAGTEIGTVGTTGNAASKPPHLHYTVSSMLPLPWRIDGSKQGWKKMFYLNPITYLIETE
ncbi:M23 family metallopeptidase [Paraflavitalea devenefica]|uniref:M23 family metallopeptidase n=1 Tax=Paraflavitalea devenefica TaxID=2716334 RepID=UPI001ABA36FC|nr:hypothetical protein [Paraflavitalea devenefica]